MFLAKLIRMYRAWRNYERSVHELSRSEIPAVAWGATRR